MIINVKGNLVKPETYLKDEHKNNSLILAHSVNALGVMGGGVALSIRQQFPDVFVKYNEHCKTKETETNNEKFKRILGTSYIVQTQLDPNLYVANLFGQLDIGTYVRQTNYEWLYQALTELFFSMPKHTLSIIAIPMNLGCGLGGGNWQVVYAMIETLFKQYAPHCILYIVEFTG